MTRTGYLILMSLTVLLGAYLFWPSAQRAAGYQVAYDGPQPTTFTVRTAGRTQEVTGDLVRVAGLSRPVDKDALYQLWFQLRELSATSDRVRVGVPEGELAAYGLSADDELSAGDLRIRWGSAAGRGYVAVNPGGRLLVVNPGAVTNLAKQLLRLDDRRLVRTAGVTGLSVNELALSPGAQGWLAPVDAGRPNFDLRVRALLLWIERLRLNQLEAREPGPLPVVGSVSLQGDAVTPHQALTVYRQGEGGLVTVTGLPAQEVDAGWLAGFQQCLASFSEDPVCDLDRRFGRGDIARVEILRDGTPSFRLERLAKTAEPGDSNLEVVWSGGRETAAPDAMDALCDAASGVLVTAPQLATSGSSAGLTVNFHHDDGRVISVGWHEDIAWSDTHRGRLTSLPRLFAELAPDRLLDLRLVRRGPERVVKVQRRQQGAEDEVYAADDGRVWTRTWPVERRRPADLTAVMRLVRAVAQASASAARLATPADHDYFAEPDLSIDLRFGPKGVERITQDLRLDEAAVKDWGLRLRRVDTTWQALQIDGGIVYDLEEAVVEEWRQPLDDALLLPVVPSQVLAFEVRRGPGGGAFRVERAGASWQLRELPEGAPRRADPIQVRRYLRGLLEARAQRLQLDAGSVTGAETSMSLALELVGGGDAPLTQVVIVGRPAGDGTVPVAVESARDSLTVRGRLWFPAAQIERLETSTAAFLATGGGP